MAQSFFIWNGIDCRSRGVTMRGPAAIVRGEERIKHVEIPGVAGDLTETEGEDVYNSYIQTVSISVKDAYNVRNIYKWLRGSGYVTFSGEPDRKQKARVVGAITLNRVSRNINRWAGEVQFYCQPLKEKLISEKATVETAGDKVQNYGDVISRPLWKVTVSSGQTSLHLRAEGNGTPTENQLNLTNMTGGSVIWIDSETMEVWNSARTQLLTKYSTGKFPVLAPGENTIYWSHIASAEIDKRERYL